MFFAAGQEHDQLLRERPGRISLQRPLDKFEVLGSIPGTPPRPFLTDQVGRQPPPGTIRPLSLTRPFGLQRHRQPIPVLKAFLCHSRL